MRQIKKLADLQLLREAMTPLDSFLRYLEQEWLELYESYSNEEAKEEFSLDQDLRMVVLELEDSLPTGFGMTYFPEYVEKMQLDDMEIYRMYIMEAEDYGVLYYSIVGTLDTESETILQEYAEMNER